VFLIGKHRGHSATKSHQVSTSDEPLLGTSGYSYQEWKGSFYPAKLPAKQMLAFYGNHFRTVEINYTFKRLPTARP